MTQPRKAIRMDTIGAAPAPGNDRSAKKGAAAQQVVAAPRAAGVDAVTARHPLGRDGSRKQRTDHVNG